jgi:acyl-coenzyme A thioesterase PaaI-like protein
VELSLQVRYAPNTICFGCGPANAAGLRIGSFPDSHADADVIAEWTPAPHHQAFAGVVNGGIIGALVDCHSNWTAAYHLMRSRGADRPPACVTADFAVRFLKPTPSDAPIHLRARVVNASDDRATVECTVESAGRVTATGGGTFVAVRPGHPAYERW